MPQTQTATAKAPVWAAQLFVLSLLIPFYINVGSLLLIPHRVVLLVMFIPCFIRLFISGKAGPVLAADWLMFCSGLWAGLALFYNHGPDRAIEASGIHMVEFVGSYLLARVAIRSEADFRKVVRTLFFVVMFLLPFALAESITHRPVLLDLLPGTDGAADTSPRWGLRRAQAVFSHPILYGVFVSTTLGLFWYALRPRWFRFIGAPASVVSTVLSLSTGALIAIVVQSIFIGWETVLKTMRKRWRLFAGLSVAGYILIDLLSNRSPFHVLVTYGTFSTGSAYNRIRIWNFGTQNVWDNPIFGLGFNEWERPSWMGGSVDNFWLVIAMRYGLPTILMVIAALVIILRRVSIAELTDEKDRLARAGYLVSFGGLCIAGGTVHYWHAMMAFALFILGSGVWAGTGGGVAAREDEADETPVRRASPYTRQPAFGQPVHGRRSATAGATPLRRRALSGRDHRRSGVS